LVSFNDCQIDLTRYVCDLGIASQPGDVVVLGIDRVDTAGKTGFQQVFEGTATDAGQIGRSSNDSDVPGIEEGLERIYLEVHPLFSEKVGDDESPSSRQSLALLQ
jgi:hypothetical protein